MARTTLVSTNARIDALEAKIDARMDRLEALLSPTAPAKARVSRPKADPKTPRGQRRAAQAKVQASEEFVTWVRETAEARAARKATNAEAAAWLRAKGLPTGGSVWEAYKAGERKVATLKRLAAKDAKARAAK